MEKNSADFPMKLAFCLFKYFPYGGLQRDFLRILRVCKSRGHTIHVFTMQWEGEHEEGIFLHLIEVKGWQNHIKIKNFTIEVKNLLSTMPFDLVIGFNKMPNLDVYYAADVCYQARVHSRSWLYRRLPRYKHFIKMEQSVFKKGRHTEILTISPFQQPEFRQFYQTETERFHLLPPGIAKDRMAHLHAPEIRAALRQSFAISPTDNLLLLVGSGFKTKGLDRALKGFAALPVDLKTKSWFFIIGQDKPQPYLQLAKRLAIEDRIKFLGGRDDVPDFLIAADALVHPSYHENTGTVILEAIASGLPVLTLENCGYAFYVSQSNCGIVLANPFDQKRFNEALQQILSSKERNIWKQNALMFAKDADIYSLPEVATDFIEQMGTKRAAAFNSAN